MWYSYIQEALISAHIFSWHDIIEIGVISTGIYYGTRWLGYDQHYNLRGYFYAYALLGIATYYAQLNNLMILLIVAFPLVATIFLLVHQNTLQKNFIALKSPQQPITNLTQEWLTPLLRACLHTLNQEKNIRVLFEHNDSTAAFIQCALPINTTVNYELLQTILSHPSYDYNSMLWITKEGTIRGAHANWRYELDDTWFSATVQELSPWKQHALYMTQKTDCVMLHLDHASRSGTIIMQGKALERLSIEQIMTILHRHARYTTSVTEKGESLYEHYQKTTTSDYQSTTP